MKIRRHTTGAGFLARAGDWLREAEAEHNLILGIAHQLRSGDHPYSPPIYLATVESGDGVVGCAWRTPPCKVGLTRMLGEALPLLADDLAGVYEAIPAVLGPEAEAGALARLWAGTHRVGLRPGPRQRIYQLESVSLPPAEVAGRLRPAASSDLDLVAVWLDAFANEAGGLGRDPEAAAHRLIASGNLYLWEDQTPRCMAGKGGETPTGVRIGYVYTPPELRRRGYATRCVAELSQRMLDSGKSLCFIYTDLSNPTSNRIYQRIGYEPVCDVADFLFES